EPVPHDRELMNRLPQALRGGRVGAAEFVEQFGPLQLGVRRERDGQVRNGSDVFRLERGAREGGRRGGIHGATGVGRGQSTQNEVAYHTPGRRAPEGGIYLDNRFGRKNRKNLTLRKSRLE